MKDLTKSQEKVWRFIKNYYKANGYRPSSSTISMKFGFSSPNSATIYIKALENKGYILPVGSTLPRHGETMKELKAWRKAFRGHSFDGKMIVDNQ